MAVLTLYLDENMYLHKGLRFDKWLTPKNSWEDIEQFQARQNDIIISTFPRSGTHWLQRIVDIIMDYPMTPTADMIIFELSLLHRAGPGYKEFQNMRTDKPRVILTHLPLTLFPKSFLETEGVKIIYCMRNFFDVAASAFKFMNKSLPDKLQDFSNFVKFLSDGKAQYGDWAEHIKLMWARREEKNTLVITYEDLKTDFGQTTGVIGDFLGRPLSPDKLRQVVEGSSLDRMKLEHNPVEWTQFGNVVDKGVINSARGLYTDEDFAYLKKYVNESLAGTGIRYAKGDNN